MFLFFYLKNINIIYIIQKKVVNASHKELFMSFMENAHTEHWISVSYLHVCLCSVTFDMLYIQKNMFKQW